MGYCMEQIEAHVRIRREHHELALDAVKALANFPGKMSGGGGGGKWYAWCDMDQLRDAKSLGVALMAMRWTPGYDVESGDINYLNFAGQKLGDDRHLFEAIAPYVEPDSHIVMEGEDGARWSWRFDGAHCVRVHEGDRND